MSVRILIRDCREKLRELPDNSVDSVVCDPPYHLTSIVKRFGAENAAPAKVGKTGAYARASKGFMGQQWDGGDVAFQPETWAEVLRVLKPGGHLVAFSGTRTYHRMAVAIEDAGFEVRDMIAWHYGSGFPKSHDISKAIDRVEGVKGEFGEAKSAAHQGWIDRGRMRGEDGHEGYQRPWMQDAEAVSNNARQYMPASAKAQEFAGYGTALKPATEPICLARKPLSEKSIAANVLKWGTGALNIDGCRIEGAKPSVPQPTGGSGSTYGFKNGQGRSGEMSDNSQGRWPANLCHDGSDEVVAGFPETEARGNVGPTKRTTSIFGSCGEHEGDGYASDSGSAARFFYCAKATTEERGEGNNHPTVKPVSLMCWLVRLVTPKGGTVLDPFMGSGSTALACDAEQFDFIGCELSADYAAIAERRIRDAAGMFVDISVEHCGPATRAA
jgi:DNA modification methylase